jgi:hypothetical protein
MVVHRFNDLIRQDLERSGLDKPVPQDKNDSKDKGGARLATA